MSAVTVGQVAGSAQPGSGTWLSTYQSRGGVELIDFRLRQGLAEDHTVLTGELGRGVVQECSLLGVDRHLVLVVVG